jgi:hypothetical protein
MPAAWTRGGNGDAYSDCDGLTPPNTPGGATRRSSPGQQQRLAGCRAEPEGCGNAGGADALPIADSWF